MYDFQEHIETPATPARVWAIYSDVEGWVRWLPHLKSISFGGPFENESGGMATVQVGMEASVAFHLENVVPEKSFDVVWKVGPFVTTRMAHTLAPTADGGTRITYAYHTGGVMAPFSFLQAAAAHDRARPALETIAALAQQD